MSMTTQNSLPTNRVERDDRTNEQRLADAEAKFAAMPIEEQAKVRAREWQITPQLALRFLQLEAEVAALKSK